VRDTAGALCLTGVAVLCALSVGDVPPFQTGGVDAPLALHAELLPAVLLIVAATWWLIVAGLGRPLSLVVVGVAWMAGALAVLSSWPDAFDAVLLAAAPLGVAGCVLALSARSSRIIAATVFGAVAAAVVHALAYQPLADPACWVTCVQVHAPLADVLGARPALGLAVVIEALAGLLAVVAATRAYASRVLRVSVAVAAAMFVAADAIPWSRWGSLDITHLDDDLRTGAVVVVLVATIGQTARLRRIRGDVLDLARRLDQTAPSADVLSPSGAGGVRAVHVAVPGEQRWVDLTGADVTDDGGTAVLVTSADNEPALRLLPATDTPATDIAELLTPVSRLVLENARLDALSRARLLAIRTSQRRIVARADNERHRIERDLHDGAQQRLVGVSLHLAATQAAVSSGAICAAEDDVRAALTSLRQVVRRELYGTLVAEGLVAAVEDLAQRSAIAIDLDIDLPSLPQLSPSVERAAYELVTASVDNVHLHTNVDRVRVHIGRDGAGLLVSVCDDGSGGATWGPGLVAVADRVGAGGGTMTLVSEPGVGTTVTARWPCAS
jgi:signal transduction histidine kinase